jgi:hypothetical protein
MNVACSLLASASVEQARFVSPRDRASRHVRGCLVSLRQGASRCHVLVTHSSYRMCVRIVLQTVSGLSLQGSCMRSSPSSALSKPGVISSSSTPAIHSSHTAWNLKKFIRAVATVCSAVSTYLMRSAARLACLKAYRTYQEHSK